MKNNNHFAEVIESALHYFLAQSWHWDTAPVFGSLIIAQAGNRTVFGIVHQVQTGSIDNTHQPIAYQKTEEELKRDQPQIFEFLRTTFSCIIVGYQEKGKILYMLGPEPVKIHTMVRLAQTEEYKNFFISDHFLPLLFAAPTLPISADELLLAILRHHAELGMLHEHILERFITTFCMLSNNDYVRLKLLLQRIEAFLPPNKLNITI